MARYPLPDVNQPQHLVLSAEVHFIGDPDQALAYAGAAGLVITGELASRGLARLPGGFVDCNPDGEET